MTVTKQFLITGAGQGFGLAVARALLAESTDHEVILGVRRVAEAPDLGRRARAVHLDLSSIASVEAFAASWTSPLTGLVNNAGLQIVDGLRTTVDGHEETFAVNYLAAWLLTTRLLPHLVGGRVLFIGSSTHLAVQRTRFETRMARSLGFRGARFTTIAAAARGDTDATTEGNRGRDRYATSKLLDVVAAKAFASRVPSTTFLTLDPGMMPGTGLARSGPAIDRFLWRTILKWLGPALMPGTTTTERAAATAAWLLSSSTAPASGDAVLHDRTAAPINDEARDPAFVDRVDAETRALLQL